MELKPCPIIIAAPTYNSEMCIGKDCAWWCDFAECCSVPLIAGILADSTICQNVFDSRVREGEKE